MCATTRSDTSTITVTRRYRDFEWLHTNLKRIFPTVVVIPPLPSKVWRLDKSGIEKRRQALQRYLERLIQHPIIRGAEVLMTFLWTSAGPFEPISNNTDGGIPEKIVSVVEQDEWSMGKAQYEDLIERELKSNPENDKAASFLKRVFYPGVELDDDARKRSTTGFQTHLELMNEHVGIYISASEKEMAAVEGLLFLIQKFLTKWPKCLRHYLHYLRDHQTILIQLMAGLFVNSRGAGEAVVTLVEILAKR